MIQAVPIGMIETPTTTIQERSSFVVHKVQVQCFSIIILACLYVSDGAARHRDSS